MKKLLCALSLAVSMLISAGTQAQTVPAGYPADYAKTIEAAKKEGKLLVYSNVAAGNWAPFIELFKQRYPGIAVDTTDSSNELWEKYYAESQTGTRTADIILVTAPDRWIEIHERGQVAPYVSPESPHLPKWSTPFPGVYSASADPMIIAFNRRALTGMAEPKSIADVATLYKKHPELKGRITAFDPEGNGMGRNVWTAWAQAYPASWPLVEQLGPSLRPERSAGPMREKVISGEYAIALMTSGAGIPQYMAPAASKLAGWDFPSDGTPIVTRNVAITKAASSPNAARVFLDLLLSRDGQIAFGKTGQMPYRADIKKEETPYGTFGSLTEKIGEKNVVFIAPDKELIANGDAFIQRWKKALGR
jgi:iron(III) transport system substrate-binding protein